MQATEEGEAAIKEREIIKEIVKIRCPYCNNVYDEKYDNCPYCGGKRTP
jgi:DNA-directed RNA polymerase subunit RPC12/RpoP